jgi:hypothetical protein
MEGGNNDHFGTSGKSGLNPMIGTQCSNQPNNNAGLIAKAMEISQRRQKQRGNDVGQGGGIGLEKGETGWQRQGI